MWWIMYNYCMSFHKMSPDIILSSKISPWTSLVDWWIPARSRGSQDTTNELECKGLFQLTLPWLTWLCLEYASVKGFLTRRFRHFFWHIGTFPTGASAFGQVDTSDSLQLSTRWQRNLPVTSSRAWKFRKFLSACSKLWGLCLGAPWRVAKAICIPTYTHTFTYLHIHTYNNIYIDIYIYILYIHIYVCIYVYIHMCVCVCPCVCDRKCINSIIYTHMYS